MNTNPRRTFIKQSSLGILGLSVLDLIPSARAEEKDDPSQCLDPNGNATGTDTDETCNQNKNLSKDEACGNGGGTTTSEDQDAACGTTKSGAKGPDDQDASCGSRSTQGTTTADEACDNGMVNGGQEPDQNCSTTEKDESCATYSTVNNSNPDEHCGYGATIPDQDNSCTGTTNTEQDYDQTNYIS